MHKLARNKPSKKKDDTLNNPLEVTKYWGPSYSTIITVDLINKYERRVLDLGCGSLRDSKYFYNCGFIVDAIDMDSEVMKYGEFFKKEEGRFNLIISDYNNYDFGKNKYLAIHAQNTLSYNSKDLIKKLFDKVYDALQNEGYFSGNLFGTRDTLSKLKRSNISSYNTNETKKMLNKFEVIKIWETEEDTKTIEGTDKHWHNINFVAKKTSKQLTYT